MLGSVQGVVFRGLFLFGLEMSIFCHPPRRHPPPSGSAAEDDSAVAGDCHALLGTPGLCFHGRLGGPRPLCGVRPGAGDHSLRSGGTPTPPPKLVPRPCSVCRCLQTGVTYWRAHQTRGRRFALGRRGDDRNLPGVTHPVCSRHKTSTMT